MSSMFDDVAKFHTDVLKLEKPELPTLISRDFMLERTRFKQEELNEFVEAWYAGDMVKVADALADLVYVALGTAWQIGIPMNQIWQAVHDANMKKIRGITKRGNAVDAVKPEGWAGPEQTIAALILRRIDNE